MARILRIAVVLLFWFAPPQQAASQSTPRRIVSLAPSVTEVLFEIGAGDRVAGVTSHCRYPREALAVPKVGGYLTPSYETLTRLAPDLVVVLPEHSDIEARLRALHLPVFRVDHRTLPGIIDSVVRLGERCGLQSPAATTADALRRSLARVESMVQGRPRPRVLACFGGSADFRRMYAGGPGSLHSDLVVRAGGQNAITSRAVTYPLISLEGMMRLDPDVIVEFASGSHDGAARLRQWKTLDGLRAVRDGRVHVFTEEFLSVPGPRFVRFAETLAGVLHPR